MAEDALLVILQNIGYLLSATAIPLAAIILGVKLFREKRRVGKYNYVRLIIFTVFTCFATLSVLEYLTHLNIFPWLNLIFGYSTTEINLYSILIGTMVSLGLVLVAYANRWEMLYFTPLVFFGGMVVFYFATGFDAWLEMYIQIAGVIVLVFLYFTALRVKDNGALGLAIFFTLVFSTVIIDMSLINQFIIIAYNIFMMVFVLGYFRVFKKEVEK